MSSNFSIEADPGRGLLRIRLEGFFDADTVAAFEIARHDAVRRLGAVANAHLTLCDVTDCKLQTQETVAAFRAQMLDPRYASRRFAFVTGNSVARMQVKRLMQRDDVACFADAAAAEAWLLAPERSAAA